MTLSSTTAPGNCPQRARAAHTLQPCMARLLYLAAEKGRVEPLGEPEGRATGRHAQPSASHHPEEPGLVPAPAASELEMAEPRGPGPQGPWSSPASASPDLSCCTRVLRVDSRGRLRSGRAPGLSRDESPVPAPPGGPAAPFLGEGRGCPPSGSQSPPRGLLGTEHSLWARHLGIPPVCWGSSQEAHRLPPSPLPLGTPSPPGRRPG